ncbi:MAG: hypothetical protein RI897_1382 [Verrucomicrobiota bacterium]
MIDPLDDFGVLGEVSGIGDTTVVVAGGEADITDGGGAFGFGEVGWAITEPVAAEEVEVFIEVGIFLD